MDRQSELESFKSRINLSEYVASVGYMLDRTESSRNSAVMRSGAGDKIIIARNGTTGHWIYFSIRDDADNGTIIDFIQNRSGDDLGTIRKTLRPWIGESDPFVRQVPVANYATDLEPSSKDILRVQSEFAKCETGSSDYLTERGIPISHQTGERFRGTICRDRRGNTIFPHRNGEGVCGFEIKNREFTGFAKGGEKGLWSSAAKRGDTRAVFAETAIDALSYHVLHPTPGSRYFSIAGSMNPTQPELIRRAVSRLPDGGEVILAFDQDSAGDDLCERMMEAIGTETARLDIREHRPQAGSQDWNDVLRALAGRRQCLPNPL